MMPNPEELGTLLQSLGLPDMSGLKQMAEDFEIIKQKVNQIHYMNIQICKKLEIDLPMKSYNEKSKDSG